MAHDFGNNLLEEWVMSGFVFLFLFFEVAFLNVLAVAVPVNFDVTKHHQRVNSDGPSISVLFNELIIGVAHVIGLHLVPVVSHIAQVFEGVTSNSSEDALMSEANSFVVKAPSMDIIVDLLHLADISLFVDNIHPSLESSHMFFLGDGPEIILHLLMGMSNWAPHVFDPFSIAFWGWVLIKSIKLHQALGVTSLHEFSHVNTILVCFKITTVFLNMGTEHWLVDPVNNVGFPVVLMLMASRDSTECSNSEFHL